MSVCTEAVCIVNWNIVLVTVTTMSDRIVRMADLITSWKECILCDIGALANKKVFGRGSIPAEVLFIGEAPGRSEDYYGVPFIGQSGELLQKAIRDSHRSCTYFITNLVSCRPCNKLGGENRVPTEEELENCRGRLHETIKIILPKTIVLLGKTAQNNFVYPPKTKIFCLEHPAYILRNGGTKSSMYKLYVKKLRGIFNATI